MMKDYKNMTQEELEKELAEIVKKNYEKGVLLLDHTFSLKRLKNITDMGDIENIDELICIMRSVKYMPDMEQYFLKDTDKIEYRCIKIVEGVPVTVFSFTDFSDIDDKIMEMYFRDRFHDLGVGFGEYPIVQMINDKFIGTLAVYFYNDEPFLDCAEHDLQVRCENAYGSNDIYLDAVRRRLKIVENADEENEESELHIAAEFIMEHLPDYLKEKLTKEDVVKILELETDYCELRDIELEDVGGC